MAIAMSFHESIVVSISALLPIAFFRSFLAVLSIFWIFPNDLFGIQVARPSENELIEVLEKYERAFHGLSFRPSTESKLTRPISTQTNYVSLSGRVWSWEGVQEGRRVNGQPGKFEVRYAGKASADDGWVFSCNRRPAPSAGESEVPMTIVFHPPRTTSAIARQVPEGFLENQTFAEYAHGSTREVGDEMFFNVPAWVLKCDHPLGPSATFFFDKETRELRGLSWKRVEGDSFAYGPLYLPPRQMPSGQWVSATLGPIDYVLFEGRRLPSAIPFKGSSSVENSTVTGEYRFSNYALLEHDLTTKIEFEDFQLPEDGERVTSQGEEGIRYELRNGKVVKIIDSQAQIAARRARFLYSPTGMIWWYGIGAASSIAIIVFLVRRSAGRQ